MSWSKKVLVVDQGNQPVEIISWKRAIRLVLAGKAELIHEGADPFEIRTTTQVFTLTTVIKELKYLYRKHREAARHNVAFNRQNIFIRDNWTCQYCGDIKNPKDLTWDHVIPKAQGGVASWENIATACFPCNQNKANRTPTQAGLTLIQMPYKPKSLLELKIRIRNMPSEVPKSWVAYFDPISSAYWLQDLET
jgi:5-methylcytosine-specific restriction endonuclease McrA